MFKRMLTTAAASLALAGATLAAALPAQAATAPRYTRADAWLCGDATAWFRAGMPADRLSLYWIAKDTQHANGDYWRYGTRLVVAMGARHGIRHAADELMIVCHPDW